MSGISILILTRNEEQDLPGCLATVAWSDDIHVFDSCSTDRTVAIAEAAGARVTQRPFDDWSTHQNWGLRHLPFKHPWVYYIDADERLTPGLIDEIRAAVAAAGPQVAAFRVRRRDYFQGRWLKHAVASPFNIRLFRPERVHYERLTNPVTVVDGDIVDLQGHFDHFPFSKGMSHWLAKHNGYSTLEARQILANRRAGVNWKFTSAFLERDRNRRRFHQKELFYRLPLRPLTRFLLFYVVRRGFLDGGPGLTYAILQAMYEYMIVLKTREMEAAER